jgi:alanine racemase
MLTRENAGALLTIDLDAICANWRTLRDLAHPAVCSAVIKADAYGLGATRVAVALAAAGCKHFFVAFTHEALLLRPQLPPDVTLYVLHGCLPGTEEDLAAHKLVPVLASLSQLDAWTALARKHGKQLPAAIQVDTGMSRLGLSAQELAILTADPHRFDGVELRHLMSHFASAEQKNNPFNRQQLVRFLEIRKALPPAPASLCNSSGVFLGSDYHFDLVRPGAALYGIAPSVGEPNPMQQVVRLQAKVVQVRSIDAGVGVGYGSTWRAPSTRRIATVAVGYADGYLRAATNTAVAYVGDTPLQLVGTVSMDTITLDVSKLPENTLGSGSLVDLINDRHPIDALAQETGTIAYEILTGLSPRYFRQYVGG